MFFHMSRRGRVRLVSYLCAAFVVLGGIALREHNRSAQLQRAVTNSYLHAFSEVTDSLDQMDTALQKGVYVTSAPMLCSLCDQVYAQATAAQLALGQLPFSNVELEQTASFVATVGDYAQSLSRQAAVEGACPEGENRENWKELSAAARQLSDQLNELELQLFDGSFTIDNVAQAEERLSQSQSTTGETDLSGFKKVEAEFPEMPSLIYDGPFSQHLTGRKPAATEGQAEISETEALAAAKRLTGWEDLTVTGQVEGTLPAYTCTGADGVRTVQITRQGGLLLSCFTQGTPEGATLAADEAVQKAQAFLASLGLEEMEESYYSVHNNILTANFCYAPDGVRCYPDLVKVSVSMADGSILGFEGQGYLTNHRERDLPQPVVSQEQAEECVSPLLTVLDRRLTVIPTRGENEVECWEFLGEAEDGSHVLCYINAQTCAEEKLLLLIEDEHGTLTI